MKVFTHLLTFIAVCSFGSSYATGHCQGREVTYFSCNIQGTQRVVFVCGASDSLQYRFGNLGKLELEFPIGKQGSLARFTGASRMHKADGVFAEFLMFEVGGVEYSVTQMEGGTNFNGVSASLSHGKRTRDFHCDKRKHFVGNLSEAVQRVPVGTP